MKESNSVFVPHQITLAVAIAGPKQVEAFCKAAKKLAKTNPKIMDTLYKTIRGFQRKVDTRRRSDS